MPTSRKPGKSKVVAFKAEEELAVFLSKLKNKSEFIRQAILAQFGVTCILCEGSGIMARGVGEHFKEVIKRNQHVQCRVCAKPAAIPSVAMITSNAATRWNQFFHGGGYYCRRCFTEAPACGDCGWHIAPDLAATHRREIHPKSELRHRSVQKRSHSNGT
jgi:hypothetical protein